ncbi:hypothetical protein MTO96_014745 [Rhipicephalus appendiculatus]
MELDSSRTSSEIPHPYQGLLIGWITGVRKFPPAPSGYGCSLWRRISTFHQPGDCCQFIYDENCGTSPKYQIYLPSCDPGLGMPGV